MVPDTSGPGFNPKCICCKAPITKGIKRFNSVLKINWDKKKTQVNICPICLTKMAEYSKGHIPAMEKAISDYIATKI